MHPVRKNEHADLGRASAEREPDSDLANALQRGVSEQAVQSNRGEQEREAGEDREKKTEEALSAPSFLDTLNHWTRVEYGLRWIDRVDAVADRFIERRGAQVGTNKQTEAGSLCLRHRTIDDRQRCHFIDRMKAHSRDHADDFRYDVTFFVIAGINCEPLADWIFAGEKLIGHRLIDDDDTRRIFCVALVESATTQKWRLKRREIIAGDHFEIGRRHITGRRRRNAFAVKSSLPAAHQRRIGTDAG